VSWLTSVSGGVASETDDGPVVTGGPMELALREGGRPALTGRPSTHPAADRRVTGAGDANGAHAPEGAPL